MVAERAAGLGGEQPAEREARLRAAAEAEAADRARLDRLRQIGRQPRIGLVGCGKSKVDFATAAQDLYVGNLFRAAREYAEAQCDDWVILSGLHGMVLPTERVSPYEYALTDLRKDERAAWGSLAGGSLVARYPDIGAQFIGLAGAPYLDAIAPVLHRHRAELLQPLDGMMLGQRVQWLQAKARFA